MIRAQIRIARKPTRLRRPWGNRSWIGARLITLLVLGMVLALTGCGPRVETSTTHKRDSYSLADPGSTRLGKATAALATQHADESGFLVLEEGADALSWRTFLADSAEKSIDAQYFLWKDDAAGKILIQRLLAAAERGVRVRVLIDDSFIESDPEYLATFSAHPKVEVRLYKPFGPKAKSFVLRWTDFVADLKVLNHRMHNKLFVVDGSVAVIGGRNIGNEYFDYPGPFVFRCRDLLAIGPVVEVGAKAFDLYWNCDWAVPVEDVVSPLPTQQTLAQSQADLNRFAEDSSHYPPRFRQGAAQFDEEWTNLGGRLFWGPAKLLVDAIPKKDGREQPHAELDRTGVTLLRLTAAATKEVQIQSAYLILLDRGFEALQELKEKGVRVTLSTNSMSSDNHLTAFVGYAKQRTRLLKTGADLFEMRPDAASERALFTSAQMEEYKTKFGLHAKTAVFDRKITFVGSYNVDPRSAELNTEMGLLVFSEPLSKAVAESIDNDVRADNSWQIILTEEGRLRWVAVKDGVVIDEWDREPMTTEAERVGAEALYLIPDDSQL